MVYRRLSRLDHLRELVQWARGRRQRRRVHGRSMLDALHPGDQVLVQPLDEAPALRPGDIVVVRHPYERDMELIKRVERIDAQGHLVLRSDNAEEGSDSRALGAFSRESVVGRVSACLHRRTL